MLEEEWWKMITSCQTEDEADRVFNDILEQEYLSERAHNRWSPSAAESVLRENIGYAAAELDREAKLRVYRLFKTEHPFFGTEDPTWEQALWSGVRYVREKAGAAAPPMTREEYDYMMHHTKDVKRWRTK